ncbi:alpha/beta hydrolase [Methanosarcina sp. MSH10X1]|uniref:alpha/beta hydrolase n=1 Tax=Methanosarcina sp. MSH10X1 TaxID=2507075 RepID=UPI001F0CD190|nr:alpha/beta hydrolase [Methanosarcina sp. MSH10X1]
MKMQIKLIIVFSILILVYSPASAAIPSDLDVSDINSHSLKSGISYNPTSFTASKIYSPSTGSSRIGLVSGNVAKYKIKVKVGTGEYDNIILTNYVQEEDPWNTSINENLLILPGQGLTEKFYSDMAIYYAQQGYSAYILDRRETNVPSNETDFSFMEDWTFDEYLKDTYKGIVASRNHTAFLNGKPAETINLTAIGHSHGALLITAYEASRYDNLDRGSVDRVVPVDIIIKYNPEELDFIQGQVQEFDAISENIKNGVFNDTDMANMMGIASLAYVDPESESLFQPGLTNMQLFRLMASKTYAFSEHPYTPDYHYWSGDLSSLYYIEENRLLEVTLTGGAVPHPPKYLDQYMSGLMGNIKGYEISASRIDSPLLYVGLGGGFGDYGSWWYVNEVGSKNNRITAITWNDQGHGSIALDRNALELWALIDNWIKNN